MALKKPKKVSITRLKKRADEVFSLWIRQRDRRCVSCGSVRNLQAGHYVSRSHMSLRYSERNVHAQCVGCNVFKHGNMDEYARYLIRTYGENILEELAKEKAKICKMTPQDYQLIIKKYGEIL